MHGNKSHLDVLSKLDSFKEKKNGKGRFKGIAITISCLPVTKIFRVVLCYVKKFHGVQKC